MLDEIIAGLDAAYRGEVFGEALYEGIAAAQPDPVRAWKWRVMAQMERETAACLAAAMARLGRPARPDPAAAEEGRRRIADYAALDWQALMRRFARELQDDIAEYADLARRAGPTEVGAIDRLVEHERVSLAFCRDEIAGRDGIAHVLALVAAPPPGP